METELRVLPDDPRGLVGDVVAGGPADTPRTRRIAPYAFLVASRARQQGLSVLTPQSCSESLP
jgi:hypothetical protein